jgi:hypothetical protein
MYVCMYTHIFPYFHCMQYKCAWRKQNFNQGLLNLNSLAKWVSNKKKSIIQYIFLSNINYQNNILLYIKNNKKNKTQNNRSSR